MFTVSEETLATSSFKTKAAWQEIAQVVFVLIDIDRLTSVARRAAVL
jgi:spore germination protein GerM